MCAECRALNYAFMLISDIALLANVTSLPVHHYYSEQGYDPWLC